MGFSEQLDALIDRRHAGATFSVCAWKGDPAAILRCELVLHPVPVPTDWANIVERHGLVVARGWIDISELRTSVDERGTLSVAGRTFALSSKTAGSASWSQSQKDAGPYSTWTL